MSIKTVAKEINNHYFNCLKKNNFKSFIYNYGHLRPSTYSILNKNYKENYKNYFTKNLNSYNKKKTKKFLLDRRKKNKINKYFKKNSLYS